MVLGRGFRLLLFGFLVALGMATAILLGYRPAVLWAMLVVAAIVAGLLLKRCIR